MNSCIFHNNTLHPRPIRNVHHNDITTPIVNIFGEGHHNIETCHHQGSLQCRQCHIINLKKKDGAPIDYFKDILQNVCNEIRTQLNFVSN